MPHDGVSLNLQVRGMAHSPTLAINAQVRKRRTEGLRTLNLGLGESPFPVPRVLVERLQEEAHRKEYLPVEGLPALRQAVAEHHRRTRGLSCTGDQVLVGPGSKELLFLLQLCFYGDILVPSPCLVSYTPQAKILGRQVTIVPTTAKDQWKVTPQAMTRVLDRQHDKYRPRLFVLNYPGNPTGVSYTADELRALAAVAREYGILVLSDEIYGGLHHQGTHASIAKEYPEGTILLDGISKWAGAGGWRLGTFTFPTELEWLRKAMSAVASETYTTVCAPVQYAAVRAFEGGLRMERYLAHTRRILQAIAAQSHRILSEAGVRVAMPDGAFYLFPDFGAFAGDLQARGITTSEEFAAALLEEAGVALLPGSAFERPAHEFTARMSLVDFDGARALAAGEAIPLHEPLPDDFVATYAPDVLEAMQRIVAWLRGPAATA
jgi:aspartate aminotransferase